MPKLTIEDTDHQVEHGTRLVLAIERAGVNIGHRCGGKARCTTCRVTFLEGEPREMTRAEYDKLVEKELLGEVRLSCQIACDRDMTVRVHRTLETEDWTDTGPEPDAEIVPSSETFPLETIEQLQP